MFRKFTLTCCLIGLATAASAHMLPKGNATLNLKGDKGYLVVSVSASALVGVDDNNDGLLGPVEIDRHRVQIQRQFSDGFSVSTQDKTAPLAFVWVTHPDNGEAEQAPSDYVIVLAGVAFSKPPKSVTVKNTLFGTNVDEKQTVVTVTREKEKQKVTLNAREPSHQFFERRPEQRSRGTWTGLIALLVVGAMAFSLRYYWLKRRSYTG